MKLKNKLILIFILFAGFVIFNNSNCFASVTYTSVINHETATFPDYDHLINAPNDIFIIFKNGSTYYLAMTNTYRYNSISPQFPYIDTAGGNFVDIGYRSILYRLENNVWAQYWSCASSSYVNSGFSQHYTDVFFTTHDLYNRSHSYIVFYATPVEPPSTKHDIFQLNLTDKNFNNSQHTFTLNTDENSVNYSEITDLIENNNKYCIYVTDYTRLLTFSDNSFYATLESGSYLLSGYIDFLVSDNAYFYFSPHYNRIKVCSGDYRGHDMTTYTKRYFFNLVYSDDSDDAYFTILDDNGILWSLSDYVNDGTSGQSEAISDFANTYFIGSNQTIYYAQEDSNYILDSLTDSIYYGKNRGEDTHVYNFAFSGGNTKEFYLNKATFNDDVLTQNNTIIEKTPVIVTEETQSEENPPVAPPVIYDTSNGQSSVIPQDTTTYTYPQDTVTDETSSQDDLTHVEPERVPYTSTDTNDDTSNWSIWDFVKGIFGKIGDVFTTLGSLVSNLLAGLVNLVIPTSQQWENLRNDYSVLGDTIQSHLPFVSFIRSTFEEAQNTVISPFDFLNITMPSFYSIRFICITNINIVSLFCITTKE